MTLSEETQETRPCLTNTGVTTAAAKTSLPAVGSAKYSYTEGLHKTLIFFESMRSGVLDRQRLAWYGICAARCCCCWHPCMFTLQAAPSCRAARIPAVVCQRKLRSQHVLHLVLYAYCSSTKLRMLIAGAATPAPTAWDPMGRTLAEATTRRAAAS